MKKNRRKITLGILGVSLLALITCIGAMACSKNDKDTSWEENRDIKRYGLLQDGTNALDCFRDSFKAGVTIWPEKISDSVDVKDYLLIHYNPFDSNYLGYLVVEYNNEEYEKEVERLSKCVSTEYIGQYGAKEFEQYKVLAMLSSDNGFVYAITDEKNCIVYVAMIFPGYGMDIEYADYIPGEYLPEGLDVSKDNPTRQKMMESFQE